MAMSFFDVFGRLTLCGILPLMVITSIAYYRARKQFPIDGCATALQCPRLTDCLPPQAISALRDVAVRLHDRDDGNCRHRADLARRSALRAVVLLPDIRRLRDPVLLHAARGAAAVPERAVAGHPQSRAQSERLRRKRRAGNCVTTAGAGRVWGHNLLFCRRHRRTAESRVASRLGSVVVHASPAFHPPALREPADALVDPCRGDLSGVHSGGVAQHKLVRRHQRADALASAELPVRLLCAAGAGAAVCRRAAAALREGRVRQQGRVLHGLGAADCVLGGIDRRRPAVHDARPRHVERRGARHWRLAVPRAVGRAPALRLVLVRVQARPDAQGDRVHHAAQRPARHPQGLPGVPRVLLARVLVRKCAQTLPLCLLFTQHACCVGEQICCSGSASKICAWASCAARCRSEPIARRNARR